ncbi:MAG: PhnD/SsuA/transferrin family substrate-binding protein [Bryobacterales bacterium]|nr:PhnD/SsuA/transferrin family substrate-binding protein [Bryobacterales bacterium]
MSRLPRRRLLPLLAATPPLCRGWQETLRLAISETLVRDVSLSDARAAMVVWIRKIVRDLNIRVDYDPQVFEQPQAFAARLKRGLVDTVALTLPEYRRLSDWLDPQEVTIASQRSKLTYTLLVRSGTGISSIDGLRGGRLLMLDSPPACLAEPWLETILHARGLESAQRFFGAVERMKKPSQVILPVFFGQAAACLTTTPSFLTVSELNPQVSRRLQPLAASPEIVSSLYAFRRGWESPAKSELKRAMSNMAATTSGRQILTLFQCDDLVVKNTSCLRDSLAILAQTEKIQAGKAERP